MEEKLKDLKKIMHTRFFLQKNISEERKQMVMDAIHLERHKRSIKRQRAKEWLSVAACCFLLFFLGQFAWSQYIDQTGDQQQDTFHNRPQWIDMQEGLVRGNTNYIRLFGFSNLAKGTVLKVVLTENGGDEPVAVKKVKVNEEGKYTWTLKRPKREQDYQLKVLFLPELQPEYIKEVYGKRGEYISDKEVGFFEYDVKGKRYTGLKLFGPVFGVDAHTTGQGSFPLDEDPYGTLKKF